MRSPSLPAPSVLTSPQHSPFSRPRNQLTLRLQPLLPQIVLESDVNHDGLLDFQEFSQYLQAHEKRLWLMFHSVDRNNDGASEAERFVPLSFG